MALLCLWLLAGCAAPGYQPSADAGRPKDALPPLPADVALNPDAGRGGYLMVTLHLADGEELPFMVDTGSSGTALDRSLKPKLGRRIGKATASGWGVKNKTDVYAMPPLYLGSTRLVTGTKVWIGDYKHPSGILGMDCLKHYCIQLDFHAGKMRFLDPDHLDTAGLGKAFPLMFRWNIPFVQHPGLAGTSTNLMIDSGCHIDGLGDKDAIKGLAEVLPECVWDGATYTNVIVAAVEHANVLGLDFLARHLVTLNFPKRIMYLKPASPGPLTGAYPVQMANKFALMPAEFLESLKEAGQLPGVSKNDQGTTYVQSYANFDHQPSNDKGVDYVKAYFNSAHKSATFTFQKNGDLSIRHYVVARVSMDGPWMLQRAWRTDEKGRTLEEYPVP